MIQRLLALAFVLVASFIFWLLTELQVRDKKRNNPRNNYNQKNQRPKV